MKYGAEFEHEGLWYGWDPDSQSYWGWSDEVGDWVEYIEGGAPAAAAAHAHDSKTSIGLYYVTAEEQYYYKGGIVEYDEAYNAYYYYTNPDNDEEYDWIPDHHADLSLAVEVQNKADMGFEVDKVPPEMKRATSVDFNPEDGNCPPDLYFDQITENYYYLSLLIHYKKDKDLYYVQDRIRKANVPIPEYAVEAIASGTVPVWNSVATSGIARPIDAQIQEPEPEPEPENKPPSKGVDITPPKPVAPKAIIPNGSIFHLQESDLNIYNAGAAELSSEKVDSLFNETLRDHFQMSRWGEYLVGRCRRTFGCLIRGENLVDSMVSRLPELTGLVQHLNELQLMMIWHHNCTKTLWSHAPEEAIRAFVFKIERTTPYLVFVRCLMRGFDKTEGSEEQFVNKYYPKEKNRSKVVEKAQEYLKKFDETHVKNMGRVIILAHGAMAIEPKLRAHVKTNPWWVLPPSEDSKAPEVFYNAKTMQAFTSADQKKPDNAVKLVCTWKPGEEKSGFHVCKA